MKRYKQFIIPLISLLLIGLLSQVYIYAFSKNIFYFPIMFLWIYIISKFLAKRSLHDLAIIKPFIGDLIRGIVYGGMISLIIISMGVLFNQLELSLSTGFFQQRNLLSYYLILPTLYLISAFYEEIHYRGLFLSFFQKGWPKLIFAILSVAAFILIHISNDGYNSVDFLQVGILGLILLSIRLRTKSIITSTGFHFALNFSNFLIEPFVISKGANMSIVSISLLCMALIFESILVIFYKRRLVHIF